jgi:hypothetical protein
MTRVHRTLRLLPLLFLGVLLAPGPAAADPVTACASAKAQWGKVAAGTNELKISAAIKRIPPECADLLRQAKARQAEVRGSSEAKTSGRAEAAISESTPTPGSDEWLLANIVRASLHERPETQVDRGWYPPISLETTNLLLHQTFSRELIFYLVIDNATVTYGPDASHQQVLTLSNTPSADPADRLTPDAGSAPGPPLSNPHAYYWFEYLIMQALKHGLTTETFEAPDELSAGDGDAATGDDSARATPPNLRMRTYAELCYDRRLADPRAMGEVDPRAFCGLRPFVRRSLAPSELSLGITSHDPSFPLHDMPLNIDVSTRSIYDVFGALGAMVRTGAGVTLVDFHLQGEEVEEQPLLNIVVGPPKARPGSGCFAGVNYEGHSYCVPLAGSENTKQVFAVLTTLLSLQTSLDTPTPKTGS